jgi:hypothetical protein
MSRGILVWVAVLPLLYAAGSFAVYAWRGRMYTRLTPAGIEVRGYRNRFVAWQNIRSIEVIDYEKVADIPVVDRRTGARPSRRRPNRKVAVVRIVRARGHRIELPAPLVTEGQSDPDFTDKARLIRARWQEAVAGSGLQHR